MWGVCFIIPLVGLILFFIYRSKDEDKKAKSAITASIIGFVVAIALSVLDNL